MESTCGYLCTNSVGAEVQETGKSPQRSPVSVCAYQKRPVVPPPRQARTEGISMDAGVIAASEPELRSAAVQPTSRRVSLL